MKTIYEAEKYNEADNETIIRVANGSNPNKVATTIYINITDGKNVTINAIGAGAVNQSVKAIIIARGMVARTGNDLYCVPGFDKCDDDNTRTIVKFVLHVRR